MVDFSLTETERDIRDWVRTFVQRELMPLEQEVLRRERNHERGLTREELKDLRQKARDAGFWGVQTPEEYGGMGLSAVLTALIEIELGRTFVPFSFGGYADNILYHANEEQKQRYLVPTIEGQRKSCFAITEPGAGSDAKNIRTTAHLDGDEWVINGSKAFITNSGTDITAFVTVTAVTGAKPDGGKEISAIVVPAGTPGFTVAPKYSKVGWNASDTHELSFSDCRVPAENLLGERGRGYAQFLSTLAEGRVAIAALGVGLAQGCVDECLRYVDEREAFGRKIGEYQAIQFKIADMELRAHTARLAYYDAASRMVRGEDFRKQAALAKLTASDAAMDNARDATQIFGGYGFMNDTPVARFYRDAKILEIGEGTSEVQRMLIARELGVG